MTYHEVPVPRPLERLIVALLVVDLCTAPMLCNVNTLHIKPFIRILPRRTQGRGQSLHIHVHSFPSGLCAAAWMISSESVQISLWTSSMLLEASTTYSHGMSGEKGWLMLFTSVSEHVDFRQGWVWEGHSTGPLESFTPDPQPQLGQEAFAYILGTKLTHIPAASQMQNKHPILLIVFLLPVTPPGNHTLALLRSGWGGRERAMPVLGYIPTHPQPQNSLIQCCVLMESIRTSGTKGASPRETAPPGCGRLGIQVLLPSI